MTDKTIRVHVIDYARKSLYMRYRDPITGKHIARSTGTQSKKEAVKIAAKWEAELQEGRYKSASKVTWKEFRERYEHEKLPGLSDNYAYTMASAMNQLEAVGVNRLSRIDADLLSRYQAHLRKADRSETTIRTYLKHLRAALGWAVEVGMIHTVPKFTMPKRAKKSKMKGRPITTEEFERMLDVIPECRPDDAAMWERYLWGLWLSGLRRAESLILSWDYDANISVDLMGKHPRLRILAEGQKGHRDELLPLTPDFAEWLLETTPDESRIGRVFLIPVTPDAAGRIVSGIGRRAKVVVDKAADQFATTQDLRRSFGTRWAARVKPATLQRLMRHHDIKTTMDFYVDQDADDIAAELWAIQDKVRQVASSSNATSASTRCTDVNRKMRSRLQ